MYSAHCKNVIYILLWFFEFKNCIGFETSEIMAKCRHFSHRMVYIFHPTWDIPHRKMAFVNGTEFSPRLKSA